MASSMLVRCHKGHGGHLIRPQHPRPGAFIARQAICSSFGIATIYGELNYRPRDLDISCYRQAPRVAATKPGLPLRAYNSGRTQMSAQYAQ
jgi:hypothetical protein